MVLTIDQMLIELRHQGHELVPILLKYCDPPTRKLYHTCTHLNREKKDTYIRDKYKEDIHAGAIVKTKPYYEYYIAMSEEYSLRILRAVLENLNDLQGAGYRAWLVGVIQRLQEWD